MNFNRLSASPFAQDWNISHMSASKSIQALLLFAGGHLIFLDNTPVSGIEAWRVWALWGDYRSRTSSVLPGIMLVCCSLFPPLKHLILLWWIFRPLQFLHVLPQMHLIVVWVFPSVSFKSVLIGISSRPSLGIPWGCETSMWLVAFFGYSLRSLQIG